MPVGFPDPQKTEKIYIIGPLDGPFKVGRTNSLLNRLSAHQVGSPLPLKMHWHREVVDRPAKDIEWFIHQTCRDWHMWGEWFGCALGDLIYVAEIAFELAQPKPINAMSLEAQEAFQARKDAGMTKREWRERTDIEILDAIFKARPTGGKMRGGPKARTMTKEERRALWALG